MLYHFIGKSDIYWVSEASFLTKRKSQRRYVSNSALHNLILQSWNLRAYLYTAFVLLYTCLTSSVLNRDNP